MPVKKTLIAIAVILLGSHGYMYFVSGTISPCYASQILFDKKYGKGKLKELKEPADTLSKEDKLLLGKLQAVNQLGTPGCYIPALFGWDIVPGERKNKSKEKA